MTPMTTSEQYVLRSRLEISPTPWSYEYRDYWGTTVTSFEVHDPHQDLTVVATSTVETQGPRPSRTASAWERSTRRAGRVVRVPRAEQLGRAGAGAARRAAHRCAQPPRRRPTTPWRSWTFLHDADRVRTRQHRGHDDRGRRVDGADRRLPGLRAPHARRAARGAHPGPLRLGLPAPVAGSRSSARPSRASRMPGSSGGTASGSAGTRPTRSPPGRATSSSPRAATTPTARRCAASSRRPAGPSSSSASRSPALR